MQTLHVSPRASMENKHRPAEKNATEREELAHEPRTSEASEPPLRLSFLNSKEALATFSECASAVSDYIDSLSSSRDELLREVEALREREHRLADELAKFRSLDEQIEKQRLVAAEAERRHSQQLDLLRASHDEIAAKTEALDRMRDEFKETLEKQSAATAELETLRVSFADADRKRQHFEDLCAESQKELRDRKKELSEIGVTLLEKTASLNELEAKLHDVEDALERSNQEFLLQAQELKETKWDLVQQREDLRVARGELARKISLLEQREKEAHERAETARALTDEMSEQKAEHARNIRRIAEQEEALTRVNEKLTEQSQALLRIDRELAKAQDEAEQKRRILRQTEEKRRLDEAERVALEQDLSVTRESLKKKIAAVELLEKQADAMNRRLGSESQKRREAEEQRDRVRSDVQTLKHELEVLETKLADSEEKARSAEEESARIMKDLESLQHEHRTLLRVEVRQSGELEQLTHELTKKTELYRESQTKAASLREQLDLTALKLEQQSLMLVTLQQKLAKEQEELQTHKRQLQKTTRLPALEAEIEDLKLELSARNLRMEQQEQLIKILQSRLSEKRVIALGARENAREAAASHGRSPEGESRNETPRSETRSEPRTETRVETRVETRGEARTGAPLSIAQKPKPLSGTAS